MINMLVSVLALMLVFHFSSHVDPEEIRSKHYNHNCPFMATKLYEER